MGMPRLRQGSAGFPITQKGCGGMGMPRLRSLNLRSLNT